jgi:prepilin-type N-terminal cleavage/methylation domain-containing protein
MKRMKIMKTKLNTRLQKGFNLLEVLIGIAIFAIGMMALASLQGNLTRSASDANMRMVATNLAEALIEQRRGFARLTDPTNTFPAYEDIVTESFNPPAIAGTAYTVNSTVVDYYYNVATDTFTTTAPPSVLVTNYSSDYKEMSVTVSWAPLDLRTDEGAVTTGASLGTGTVNIVETISSVTSAASSKVASQEEDTKLSIAITYTPGQNPDVVGLALGDNKFKESLTPLPKVIKSGELVDTRFDVVTYSQIDGGSVFVRREEFASVTCECELGNAATGGHRPALWAGDEYKGSLWVDKPYGTAGNNRQQSQLCGSCCSDHHDGGVSDSEDEYADTAARKYNPFRAGDHEHYNRAGNGSLVLADAANPGYLEACRLVRVGGFFKVMQDFRQEDLNVFPEDFLDDAAEITTYSTYVTTAADEYELAASGNYETAPPCIGGPLCVEAPVFGGAYPTALAATGEFPSWTQLSVGIETEQQQLRSRGVYIDYMSDDLRTLIDTCLRSPPIPEGGCAAVGDVELDVSASTNILEIIPFFDVQMTKLFRWNETPANIPVDTTNQALAGGNTHDRGIASMNNFGSSDVKSIGHRNNLSFTDSPAIDPNFEADLVSQTINVQAVGGTPLPVSIGDRVVSGNISETINGLRAADVDVEGGGGAQCDRTPGGFECTVPASAVSPTVTFLGYGIADVLEDDFTITRTYRWTCLTGNILTRFSELTSGITSHAVFNLYNAVDPQPDGAGYNVNVKATSCGGIGG